MKKFGLRIGNIGIEFASIEDRDKAIRTFTHGVDVVVSDAGIKYSDGIGTFSVYDRDTKEVLTTCYECSGVFGIDTCKSREYDKKYSYSNDFSRVDNYICDACFAMAVKAKEVFDAKQLIEKEET